MNHNDDNIFLNELKAKIERRLRRKITDGEFGLLLGYAKKTRSAKEAYSRLWRVKKLAYLPSSIYRRCDELRGMTAAELKRELNHTPVTLPAEKEMR